jgi:hypothetical protein
MGLTGVDIVLEDIQKVLNALSMIPSGIVMALTLFEGFRVVAFSFT